MKFFWLFLHLQESTWCWLHKHIHRQCINPIHFERSTCFNHLTFSFSHNLRYQWPVYGQFKGNTNSIWHISHVFTSNRIWSHRIFRHHWKPLCFSGLNQERNAKPIRQRLLAHLKPYRCYYSTCRWDFPYEKHFENKFCHL